MIVSTMVPMDFIYFVRATVCAFVTPCLWLFVFGGAAIFESFKAEAYPAPPLEETYSYDGRGNNPNHLEWGAANTARIRTEYFGNGFIDGLSIPADETNTPGLPSARRIMEELFSLPPRKDDKKNNHFLVEFGHIIVHDIIGATRQNDSESFPIPCDGTQTDVIFCPVTGISYNLSEEFPKIPFFRHKHVDTNTTKDREVKPIRRSSNAATAFLDLSHLYGSTLEDAEQMRGGEPGGRLKIEENGLLEFRTHGNLLHGINASPGAYALDVLFIRYHNKVADEISKLKPHLSGNAIYGQARKQTIAVYQKIFEDKYVPTLLGEQLDEHTGYKVEVDPSIDEFFASMSMRYAHTTFSGIIRHLGEDFLPTKHDPILLRDIFKQPFPRDVLTTVNKLGGIEPIIRGLVMLPGKGFDASFVDGMNFFTEGTTMKDIQRGRDVGLPLFSQARKMFGLPPLKSLDELSGDDAEVKTALNNLYGGRIDLVDAYVGALLEKPETPLNGMGPLFTRSLKDQFTRVRDGDRFWYKNRYLPEEYATFPTLTDLVKMCCTGMDNFPSDPFLTSTSHEADDGQCSSSNKQVSLLGGQFVLGWQVKEITDTARRRRRLQENNDFEVTMLANQEFEGPGFFGVGFNSNEMRNAEIWFCFVNEDQWGLRATNVTVEEECSLEPTETNMGEAANNEDSMFSCCVAHSHFNSKPICANPGDDVFYELTVTNWCMSKSSASVTVSTRLCGNDEDGGRCFKTNLETTTNIIVAYNHVGQNRPHGYERRTNAEINLLSGSFDGGGGVADQGLIATHAMFMLFCWMICAPAAVFIMRYMKTWKYHVAAHVTLMTFNGGMMLPLLVGLEASVGASSKLNEHSIVGLSMMFLFLIMAFSGRVRMLKIWGTGIKNVKINKRVDRLSTYVHVYGGYVIVVLCFWNCFTGLTRIGPEDSYMEVVLLNTYAMGYDVAIFGFIKQYIFFPYVGIVALIFAVAEWRKRQGMARHAFEVENIVKGSSKIWDEDDDVDTLETMSAETFMKVTKLGKNLCICDGRVLDITDFINVHPGGRDLLRHATGSDITREILGEREVDGIKHVHSKGAFQMLRRLVVYKLEKQGSSLSLNSFGNEKDRSASSKVFHSKSSDYVFQPGLITANTLLTPASETSETNKSVILLQVELAHSQVVSTLPGVYYTFRGENNSENVFERHYTPVNAQLVMNESSDSTKPHLDFLISLIPGGKMSEYLLNMKLKKKLMIRGPLVCPSVSDMILERKWKSLIMFASGTGVAPMLQVIDYHLKHEHTCKMFLVWFLKSPEHGYLDAIRLNERSKISSGRFKWTIIYLSHGQKRKKGDSMMGKTSKNINQSLRFEATGKMSTRDVINSARKQVRNSIISVTAPLPSGTIEFNAEFWRSGAGKCSYNFISARVFDELINSIKAFVISSEDHEDSAGNMIDGISEKSIKRRGERATRNEDGVSKAGTTQASSLENYSIATSDVEEGVLNESSHEKNSSVGDCYDENTILLLSGSPFFDYEAMSILNLIGFDKTKILYFSPDKNPGTMEE